MYEEGAKEVALSVVRGINCRFSLSSAFYVSSISLLICSRKKFIANYFFKLGKIICLQQVFSLMDKQAVERLIP